MSRDYGWYLPPGVSDSMIPGNRPEDEAYSRFFDARMAELERDIGAWLKSQGWSNDAIKLLFNEGYPMGWGDDHYTLLLDYLEGEYCEEFATGLLKEGFASAAVSDYIESCAESWGDQQRERDEDDYPEWGER